MAGARGGGEPLEVREERRGAPFAAEDGERLLRLPADERVRRGVRVEDRPGSVEQEDRRLGALGGCEEPAARAGVGLPPRRAFEDLREEGLEEGEAEALGARPRPAGAPEERELPIDEVRDAERSPERELAVARLRGLPRRADGGDGAAREAAPEVAVLGKEAEGELDRVGIERRLHGRDQAVEVLVRLAVKWRG